MTSGDIYGVKKGGHILNLWRVIKVSTHGANTRSALSFSLMRHVASASRVLQSYSDSWHIFQSISNQFAEFICMCRIRIPSAFAVTSSPSDKQIYHFIL